MNLQNQLCNFLYKLMVTCDLITQPKIMVTTLHIFSFGRINFFDCYGWYAITRASVRATTKVNWLIQKLKSI